MTTPATRIINGETWTQDPDDPNRWHGPDADPAAQRTHANGYGGSDIIRTPEGWALRAGRLPARTGWRPASVPLTPRQNDHRSVMADPARRADFDAERRAENRARAFQLAARRAALVAQDVAERFAEKVMAPADVALAQSLDVPLAHAASEADLPRIPVPRVSISPSGRRKVWHRMTSAMVILAEINGEWRRAIDDTDFAASRAEYHKGRARVMFSPVERAAATIRVRESRARRDASETAEQREARLARERARVRAYRAARLASADKLTAADATL